MSQNAHLLRIALQQTRTRKCGQPMDLRDDDPQLPLLSTGEAIEFIRTGQVVMLSRERIESIANELERSETIG